MKEMFEKCRKKDTSMTKKGYYDQRMATSKASKRLAKITSL